MTHYQMVGNSLPIGSMQDVSWALLDIIPHTSAGQQHTLAGGFGGGNLKGVTLPPSQSIQLNF